MVGELIWHSVTPPQIEARHSQVSGPSPQGLSTQVPIAAPPDMSWQSWPDAQVLPKHSVVPQAVTLTVQAPAEQMALTFPSAAQRA